MTRSPLHVVALLDHSDHQADPRCPCRPEPARDLAEPITNVYVHHRPMPPRPDEVAKAAIGEAETLIRADPSLDMGDFTHDDGQEGAKDR